MKGCDDWVYQDFDKDWERLKFCSQAFTETGTLGMVFFDFSRIVLFVGSRQLTADTKVASPRPRGSVSVRASLFLNHLTSHVPLFCETECCSQQYFGYRQTFNFQEDHFHFGMFFNILVLARVRVTLTDTVIRLEHLINNGDNGVALEIRIKK